MVVHPVDIQDRDGAKLLVANLSGRFPNLSVIWTDSGYAGKLADWVRESAGLRVYDSEASEGGSADSGFFRGAGRLSGRSRGLASSAN